MIYPTTSRLPQDTVQTTAPLKRTVSDQSFNQQLAAALTDTLAKFGVSASQIQVNVGQTPAAGSDGRQIVVTLQEPNDVTSTASTASPAPTGFAALATWAVPPLSATPQTAAVTAPAAATAPQDPVQVLSDKLRAAGVDPTGLNLTASHEIVRYFDGAYENNLITATFPGGVQEHYGIELMMKNPEITVAEIERLLGRPA